ncbi:Anti-sigma-E factor ChrR [Alphaproteobacteria bacterium SO-S41]|nr:Anti-sigma-E factor ChrR [Alphaproteobacteria bacterium SO-S41]
MTQHHPTEEYLLHHAAGALPEGQALLVAAHLTFCPECRETVRQAEALGGAFLEEDAANPVDVVAALARFPFDLPPEAPQVAPAAAPISDIPLPLQPYMGARLSGIRWRTFWPGMQTVRIHTKSDPAADVSLLRLASGKGMPIHTHGGDELTIVLHGSYTDETGQYSVGDVATADPTLTHRPIADAGGHCVCFTVIEAPLKFASPWARLAERFLFR